jgi:hypothetical protein
LEGEGKAPSRGLAVTIAVMLIHPWSDIRNSRCRKTPRLETPDPKPSGGPRALTRAYFASAHEGMGTLQAVDLERDRRSRGSDGNSWQTGAVGRMFDRSDEVAGGRGVCFDEGQCAPKETTQQEISHNRGKENKAVIERRSGLFKVRPLGISTADSPCIGRM